MRLVLMMLVAVSILRSQGGGGAYSGPSPDSSQPKVTQRAEPEYTVEALASRIEGRVTVSGTIGTDGIPKDISVVKGLGYGLDEKAVECFSKWRFHPATRKGEPIEMRAAALVIFRLPKNSK